MKDNTDDKFIQNRKSAEVERSWIKQLQYVICPCLRMKLLEQQKEHPRCNIYSLSTKEDTILRDIREPKLNLGETQLQNNEIISKRAQRKQDNAFLSTLQNKKKKDQIQQYFNRRLTFNDIDNHYPVSDYNQNKLLVVGSNSDKKMLVKISMVSIKPPARLLEKTRQNIEKQKGKHQFSNPRLQQFWVKRYLLFEKFDLGIQLDEESWFSVTPQAVAQHISSRIQCQVVLDGFCGAGGDAIKLANTCYHVIANDIDYMKLENLKSNAAIYTVDNIEIMNQDFLKLKELKVDVVYLAPPWRKDYDQLQVIKPKNYFEPSLSKILQKAFTISNNIVLLLPPNVDIQQLCSLFAATLSQNSNNKNISCSIEVEKIQYMDKLAYICVYYGPAVNRKFKLGDELSQVYEILKGNNQGSFQHKKVVKELRETYGMVSLLNYALEATKMDLNQSVIHNFYELIKIKQLINLQKLNILIKYQQIQNKKLNLKNISDAEQQKFEGRSQQTHSYATNQSIHEEVKDIRFQKAVSMRQIREKVICLNSEINSPMRVSADIAQNRKDLDIT